VYIRELKYFDKAYKLYLTITLRLRLYDDDLGWWYEYYWWYTSAIRATNHNNNNKHQQQPTSNKQFFRFEKLIMEFCHWFDVVFFFCLNDYDSLYYLNGSMKWKCWFLNTIIYFHIYLHKTYQIYFICN